MKRHLTTLQRESDRAQRAVWAAEEAARIETAKAGLAATYGLPRDARFDLAWRIAWDWSHSEGIDSVCQSFDELVPLLKP